MKNLKHVYDIDRIGILQSVINNTGPNRINFYDDNKHRSYTELLRISAEESLEMNETELNHSLEIKEAKIIVPLKNDNRYWMWMSIQLSISDVDKLPLILFHHWKKLKYANWFLNHVEFGIVRCIVSNNHFDIAQHKKAIVKWIVEQRKNIIIKNRSFKIGDFKADDDTLVDVKVQIPAIAIIDGAIEEVQSAYLEFVDDSQGQKNLKKILRGEKISDRIKMNCSANFFVSALIKLNKQMKVLNWKSDNQVKDWVVENFKFYSKRKKDYVCIKPHYLIKVFYGQKDLSDSLQRKLNNLFKGTITQN